MNKPTLLKGVFAALVLSLVGGSVFTAAKHLTDPTTALEVVIALVSAGYLVWLVSRSEARIGRVTTLAAWCVATAVLWIAAAPLPLYLLTHVAMIWLVRSLYFHSSVIPALLDLCLNVLSVGAALWAVEQTASVFVALWCFFLVQALFVAIPEMSSAPTGVDAHDPEPTFERARRAAEAALRRIST